MGIFKKLKKPDFAKEAELRAQIEKEGGLEKGDLKAMIISALLVFLPVAMLVLGLLALLILLII